MKKYRYLKLSDLKKLRYLANYTRKDICLVFLPGFMSDIDGEKPSFFKKFAEKKKINFLAIEYSGHGKSSGEFVKGNISTWTRDAKYLINKLAKHKKLIIIGSSMGSWIALNLFKFFKKQIFGFVGIGSAPEFLDRLMWKKFNKKIKKEILSKGIAIIKHGNKKDNNNYEYPITYQLVKDGKKNKVLSKKINSKIFVTMFHGKKDEVVPANFSIKVLKLFINAEKKLILIKNGDHSLSQKKNLNRMALELEIILNQIS